MAGQDGRASGRKGTRKGKGATDGANASGEVTTTPPGALARPGEASDAPEPTPPDPAAPRAKVRRRSGLKPEDKKQLTEAVRTGRKRDRAKQKAREAAIAAKGTIDPEPTAGQPSWEPTEEDLGQIEAMAGLGFTIEETCIVLGISEETWQTHAESLGLRKKRVQGLVLARTSVRQALYDEAVSGSLGHIRLYMEVVEGYVARTATELTGKNGGPVQQESTTVAVTGPLPDAEIMARLRTLADRAASVVSTTAVHAQPASTPAPTLAPTDGATEPPASSA